MKRQKIRTFFRVTGIVLPTALILFTVFTCFLHRIKSAQEMQKLKENGYYNPISAGDYSLNAAVFGNPDGKHTVVCMAGLGSGDCPAAMRQMTAPIEKDSLVVFADRAGYGFSDDTSDDMTLDRIVGDYRKTLQNAGIEPPYVLMPHSIGGAYATAWCSRYPEEIEAVVFIDGSQLSADAFDDEPAAPVSFGDRALAFLAKMGFSRYALRHYFYHYPDSYTEEEQYLGDALQYLTLDSLAPVSEAALRAENASKAFSGIVTNDVPKLYICASWGFETADEINEYHEWTNRQIEINRLKLDKGRTDYSEEDDDLQQILAVYREARENIIYPYAEKMGNCEVVLLGGDHMIYEQKPAECAEIITAFLARLE